MGWIRDLVSILQGEVTAPSRRLLYGRVPHVTDWEHDPTPVEPGTHYLRWWLQEMWLKDERVGLDHYTPLVYSTVKLTYGNEQLEIPATLGDFKFAGLDDIKDMSAVLKLNYPMTNYLPYNGGSVSLAAALVGVRTVAGVKEILEAAEELSGVFSVPQLSAVTAVAGPVVKVLDSVLGRGDQHVALGLQQTFSHGGQEPLRSGYYVTARTDAGPGLLDELEVNNGTLCHRGTDKPFNSVDYLLFRLETSEQRSDVEGLSGIFDLVGKAEAEALNDNLPGAQKYLQQAKLAAWQSDDLTRADRKRLPGALDVRFAQYLQTMGIAGGGAGLTEEVPLGELVAQVTPEAALAMNDAQVLEVIFGD